MIDTAPALLFIRIIQGCTLLSSESKGCSLSVSPIVCNETLCAHCRRVSILIRTYSCGHCLCQECSKLSYLLCICCKDFIQDSVLLVPPIDRLLSALSAAIQCPYSTSCRSFYSISAYLNHIYTEHYSEAYLAAPTHQLSTNANNYRLEEQSNKSPESDNLTESYSNMQVLENLVESFCKAPSTDNLVDIGQILRITIAELQFIGKPEVLKARISEIEEAIVNCPIFSHSDHQSILEKASKVFSADDFRCSTSPDTNAAHMYNLEVIRRLIFPSTEIPSKLQQLRIISTITSLKYTPYLSNLFINLSHQLPSVEALVIDNKTFHFSISTIIQLRNRDVKLQELYLLDCYLDIDLNTLRELRTVWLPTLVTLVIDFSILTRTFANNYLELLSYLAYMHISNFIGYDYLNYRASEEPSGKRTSKRLMFGSSPVVSRKGASISQKGKEPKNYKPFILQKIERSTILINSVSEKLDISGPGSISIPIPIAYSSHNHSFSKDTSTHGSRLSCDDGQSSNFDVIHVSEDRNLAATSPPMLLAQYHSSLCQRYGVPLGLVHYPISSDLPFLGFWGDDPLSTFIIVFDGIPYDISEVAVKLIENTVISPLLPLPALKATRPFSRPCTSKDGGKSKRKERTGKREKDHEEGLQPPKQTLAYLFYDYCPPPSSQPITFSDFTSSFTPELMNLLLLLLLCRYDVPLTHLEVLVLNLSENLTLRKGITDYVIKSLAMRNNAEIEQILEYRTQLSFIRRKDDMPTKVPVTHVSTFDSDIKISNQQYDRHISLFLETVIAILPYLPSLKGIKLGMRSSTIALLLPPYNAAIYTSLLKLILITSRRLVSFAPTINYIFPLLAGVERFKTIDVFYANAQSIYEMIRGEFFNTHYRTLTSLLEDGKKVGALEMANSTEDDINNTDSPGRTFTSLCNITIMTPGGKDLVYGNDIDGVYVNKPFRLFKYSVSSFDFQYDLETTMPPVHPQQLVDLYGPSGGSLKSSNPCSNLSYVFAHLHIMLQPANLGKLCLMDLLPLCPPRTIIYCLQLISEGSGSLLYSSFNALEAFSIPCSTFFLSDSVADPAVAKLENLQTTIGFRRPGAGNKSESTSYKQDKYYNFVKYRCMLDKAMYSRTLMAQYRFVRYERRLHQQHRRATITISKPIVLNNSYVHFFLNITSESLHNLYVGSRNFTKGPGYLSGSDMPTINILTNVKEILDRFVVGYDDISAFIMLCSSPTRDSVHMLERDDISETEAEQECRQIWADCCMTTHTPSLKNAPKSINLIENSANSPDTDSHDSETPSSGLPGPTFDILLPPRQPPTSTSKQEGQYCTRLSNKLRTNRNSDLKKPKDGVSHQFYFCNPFTLVTLRLITLTLLNFDGLFYQDLQRTNRIVAVRLQRSLSQNIQNYGSKTRHTESYNGLQSSYSSHTLTDLLDKYLQEQAPYSSRTFYLLERFLAILLKIPTLSTDSTLLNMLMMERDVLFPRSSRSVSLVMPKHSSNSDIPTEELTKKNNPRVGSPVWKTPRLGMQFAPSMKTTRFAIDSSAVGTLSELKSQITTNTGGAYTNSIITIIRRREAIDLDVDETAHIVFNERGLTKTQTLDIPSIDGLSIITALHNEEDVYTSTFESPYTQQVLGDSITEIGPNLAEREVIALQDPSLDFPTIIQDDSPYQVTPNLRGYVASQRPVALLTICKPLLYYYVLFRLLISEKELLSTLSSPIAKFTNRRDNFLADSPSYASADYIVLPIGGASFNANNWSVFSICKSVQSVSGSLSSNPSFRLEALKPKRLSSKRKSSRSSNNFNEHAISAVQTSTTENQEETLLSIHLSYLLLQLIYKQDDTPTSQRFQSKRPPIVLVYGSGRLFKCPDTVISARLLALLLKLLTTGALTDVIIDSDVLLRYFPISMSYNAFILNSLIVSKLYKNGTLILGWDNAREGVDIPFSLYLQLFQEISAIQPALENTKPLAYLDLSGTLTDMPQHSIYDCHNYSELQFKDFLANTRSLDHKIGFYGLILPAKVLQIFGLRKLYRLADIISTVLSCSRLQTIVFSSVCSIFKLIDDGPELHADLPPEKFNARYQIRSLMALKLSKSSTLHVYNRNWTDVFSFLNYVGEKCRTIFSRICTLDFTPSTEVIGGQPATETGAELFNQNVSPLVIKLIACCTGIDRIIIPSKLICLEDESAMLILKEWIQKAGETKKLQEIVLSPSNEKIAQELKSLYPNLLIVNS